MTQENKNLLLAEKEILDLTRILNLKNGSYLKDRTFKVDFCESENEILASITLMNPQKTFFYQVESRVSVRELGDFSSRDSLLLMFDYMDLYFEEFFREEENLFIPIDWSDREFEGLSFQMKGQVKNLHCEFLADELLKERSAS